MNIVICLLHSELLGYLKKYFNKIYFLWLHLESELNASILIKERSYFKCI